LVGHVAPGLGGVVGCGHGVQSVRPVRCWRGSKVMSWVYLLPGGVRPNSGPMRAGSPLLSGQYRHVVARRSSWLHCSSTDFTVRIARLRAHADAPAGQPISTRSPSCRCSNSPLTCKEIRRVDLDAVKPDLQRARLSIHDDAARRMQRVLVSGSWATGPGRCHHMSVIIPEPVGHGCDDFAFEICDVNCLRHDHRQAGHLITLLTRGIARSGPTRRRSHRRRPAGVPPRAKCSDGDVAQRRLTDRGRRRE